MGEEKREKQVSSVRVPSVLPVRTMGQHGASELWEDVVCPGQSYGVWSKIENGKN